MFDYEKRITLPVAYPAPVKDLAEAP